MKKNRIEQAMVNALKSSSKMIYHGLLSMYYNTEAVKDLIKNHYEQDVPFGEWFSFIFEGEKWVLKGPLQIPLNHIHVSESKFNEAKEDFTTDKYKTMLDNFNISKMNYITVVKPEDKYLIVDGYHRYYMASEKDLVEIPAFEWVKEENKNPIARELKQLIINNLKP